MLVRLEDVSAADCAGQYGFESMRDTINASRAKSDEDAVNVQSVISQMEQFE